MDKDIKNKVELLRQTPLFTGNAETQTEKQSILLTLTGQKPLSEVTTGVWEYYYGGRKSVPEDHRKIEVFFNSIGLRFSIRDNGGASNVIISKSQDLIDSFYNGSSIDIGLMFGYPETAVRAFNDKELLMDTDLQDKIMDESGLPLYMPSFRLSKQNYIEELEVLKSWAKTLRDYGIV